MSKFWLISDKHLKEITNNYENDWALMVFRDNGIISPEDARDLVSCVRFKHVWEDCPFCGTVEKHYRLAHDLLKCKSCFKKFSVTTGTFIEKTKIELHDWWRFSYLIGEMKIINSLQISRDLCVTQKTAWNMIDTLKRSRKQQHDGFFPNGTSILSFKNEYEVLDILFTLKNKPNRNT